MSKKILQLYYRTVFLAVCVTVILWLALSYLIFFANTSADSYAPENLIQSINQYITQDNGEYHISESLKKTLLKYNYWIQIIDGEGAVILSENAPGNLPLSYTHTSLTKAVLSTNGLDGYTVFSSSIKDDPTAIVILGCDSSLYTKISITLSSSEQTTLFLILGLLVCIALFVVIIISVVFIKKVTHPMSKIQEDLNRVEQTSFAVTPYNGNIFKPIFKQINHLHARLMENQKTKDQWISNISHDLKSPLVTIRGNAEIISNSKYSLTSDEYSACAEEILHAEQSMEDLIYDLRLSSKFQEGKIILKQEEINLGVLLAECKKDMQFLLENNSEILIDDNCAKYTIYIDPKMMKRCFNNIISNALQHNPSPVCVQITVTTSAIKDFPAEAPATNPSPLNMLQVRIADNGNGIPREQVPYIFTRYYSGEHKYHEKSSGLGLAIAKEIVEVHNGQLFLESSSSKGSTFCMYLPLSETK